MSLVGTRPILQDELQKYELHHRARIAIKPGITGMWQVSGRSDITDFEEVVRLDTEYISNWNFGLDIKILFKTVMTVLKIDGLMLGVGAGFDYYAENIKRAPMWMQKSNLEWVYRLMQDPKRLFKRYWSTNTKDSRLFMSI